MFGCSYNLIKTAKELIKANNMCNYLRESGCVFASTCLFVSLSVGRMLKRLRMNFREIYIRGRSSARNNHLAVGGDLEPPCEKYYIGSTLVRLVRNSFHQQAEQHWDQCVLLFTACSINKRATTFVHNFAKCWPILNIF